MALRGAANVAVRPSAIHGIGVFAIRDFAVGEIIFVRDETREVTPEHPLRPELGEYEWHCDWLEGGRQVYLPVPERHVNHSCDANSTVIWRDGEAQNIALRPIRSGEEVTHHYFVNLGGGDAWECNCGSERCLHHVPGSFFELPLDRQVELLPLLADWFIAEHPDKVAALRQHG